MLIGFVNLFACIVSLHCSACRAQSKLFCIDWFGEPSTAFTITRSRMDKGMPAFFVGCFSTMVVVFMPVRCFYPSTNTKPKMPYRTEKGAIKGQQETPISKRTVLSKACPIPCTPLYMEFRHRYIMGN